MIEIKKTIIAIVVLLCFFIGSIIGAIFIGQWLFSLVHLTAWAGLMIKVVIVLCLLKLTGGFVFIGTIFWGWLTVFLLGRG